jgi:hypothetical protein
MDLTGRVKVVMEEKAFASGFTKREFVVTTEDQYPQDIIFELLKEKGSLINAFKPGDRVIVRFDVRGREWQGKYFNSLVAWKIEAAGAPATAPAAAEPQNYAYQTPSVETARPAIQESPMEDDLPF